jgi:hypothetical protein
LRLQAWLACAILVAPPLAGAQGHDCAKVADEAARLACYDAAFGRPAPAPAPAPAAAVAPAPAAAAVVAPATGAPASPEAEFGLTGAAILARDPEKAAAEERKPTALEATVTGLEQKQGGQLVLTLDNGQTWIQSEAGLNSRVRVGDRVKIRKAALGSFVLVTPAGVGMKVRRIR